MRQFKLATSVIRCIGVAVIVIVGVGGCQSVHQGRGRPATQTDRLMQAYDDLRGGRFVVIADFENPLHMELFQLVSVSDKARCVLDKRGGRPQTGKACLRFDTGSPDDTVVITNAASANWYLKRDWRPYDLLLMVVESPDRGLSMSIAVTGGTDASASTVHSEIPLEKGWNLVRLDLAEVGERIPLDDIQGLRLSLSGAESAATVRLDDLILASNTEDVFGDSGNREGDLYVQRVGRRWRVGAGGRFETTFANGQIVGWHNLAADPHRLRNLVAGTTLGPYPLTLVDGEPDEQGFAALAPAVMVHPRIVEMSAVRVVVACDWRFVEGSDASPDGRPFQRWVYTIYPTGQIYARVECTARVEGWSAGQLGLAVSMSAIGKDAIQVHTATDPSQPPTYAVGRSVSGGYSLTFAPAQPCSVTSVQERAESGARQITFIASKPPSEAAIERWACVLSLGTSGDVSKEELAVPVADYHQPPALDLQAGSLVTAGSPYLTAEGFDRASGSYLVVPEDGHVQVVVAARKPLGYGVAITVMDSRGLDAWVYVNHLIHEQVARDADGNVVFQLPAAVGKSAVVEVLLRRRPRSDDA